MAMVIVGDAAVVYIAMAGVYALCRGFCSVSGFPPVGLSLAVLRP